MKFATSFFALVPNGVRPVHAHRLSHAHYCGHFKPRMLEAAWIAGLRNNRHARSKTCQETMRNPGPRQRTFRVLELSAHRCKTVQGGLRPYHSWREVLQFCDFTPAADVACCLAFSVWSLTLALEHTLAACLRDRWQASPMPAASTTWLAVRFGVGCFEV